MSAGAAWIRSGEVHDALGRLGPVLIGAAGSSDPRLSEMARYLASLGGKRIRPALVFIAHGPDCTRPEVLRAAAAVELIHLASLYHDDIMDRGSLRRGAPSANAKWGNGPAMLAGTFLFMRAQALAEMLGPQARKLAATAAAELCLGQLRESENAYDTGLLPDVHLEVLALKTGALFRLALQLGALLGGHGPRETAALTTYARHFGLAFQLSDDLLDIESHAAMTGKDSLLDVRTGLYSLPWLLLMAGGDSASQTVRRLFGKSRLTMDDARQALGVLGASDAIARARECLASEIRQAVAALRGVPDAAARASLADLAGSMALRDR